MENIKKYIIIQFEEDENYQTIADLICYNMGLVIEKKASNVQQANQILQEIIAEKIAPDIAIISSDLGRDINDGSKLAQKLKELVPDIKIIAYTIIKDSNWGDYLAVKSTKNTDKSLVKALEELTGKKYAANNITG